MHGLQREITAKHVSIKNGEIAQKGGRSRRAKENWVAVLALTFPDLTPLSNGQENVLLH
ncbi:hypothetical protein HDF08_002462 [Edaphobacter lichenicola]|uniref:Uncharacterized protein n=1 Tax=Tunturiibacter lichenicola TaxID=2051959 RepID=A0A852VJT6_9BACT|nr:hypothetical protein [Edaphobacter lichenicola]